MLAAVSQTKQLSAERAARWMLSGSEVSTAQALAGRYAPISLGEMAGVALLNRTDTKFVISIDKILAVLAGLNEYYRVLDVAGVRLSHYRTLYFDTADFALYKRHHAGAADRYKVRSRAYLESNLAFFEVKHKTNKKRTIKERMRTDQFLSRVDWKTAGFLQQHYPYGPAELLPALFNSFMRMTLVSTRRPERLTLDFDLSFQRGQKRTAFPGIAVVEVKREGFALDSDFIRQVRSYGVRPTSFSKYCLGLSALTPQLKQNNFKRLHLLVQDLMQGGRHAYIH